MNSKLSPTPNRELDHEEVDKVLDQIPLIVLADDDPNVLTVVTEYLILSRKNADSVLRLEGNMEQCFDAAKSVKAEHLPIILCRDGVQALTATRIAAERQIEEGLMLFDHRMGLPQGLDIFKGINGNLHPGITKALMTATPPDETEDCLIKGVLDLALTKPLRLNESRKAIATTYFKKTSALR